MSDLSSNEISHILSFSGYSNPYERVSTPFAGAVHYEKERLMKYMDEVYPGWTYVVYMPIYANMAALDSRWDLVLVMLDFHGCDDALIPVLQLLHVFQMEELADKVIEKCGLPTDRSLSVVVYHMWRLNLPGKEQALERLIESLEKNMNYHTGKYIPVNIFKLIGFITPEMRQYIIDHILTDDPVYVDLKMWLNPPENPRFQDTYIRKSLRPYPRLFEYNTDTFYQHALYAYETVPDPDGPIILGRTRILTAQIEQIFKDTKDKDVLDSSSNIILLMEYPELVNRAYIDRFVDTYANNHNTSIRERLQRLQHFNII